MSSSCVVCEKLEYKRDWLHMWIEQTEGNWREFERESLVVAKNDFVAQTALFWLRTDKSEASRLREAAADRLINLRGVSHSLCGSIESLKERLGDVLDDLADHVSQH